MKIWRAALRAGERLQLVPRWATALEVIWRPWVAAAVTIGAAEEKK